MLQHNVFQERVETPIDVTRINEATRELMNQLMVPKLSHINIDPEQPPHDPIIRYWWEVAGRIEEEEKRRIVRQIRVSLPDNRVEPNDKLTKTLFDPSDDILKSHEFDICEHRDAKNNIQIKTPVSFQSEIDVFDTHDREVGMACFSLWQSGNRFVTTEQIYRMMTGNSTARLYEKEEERIRRSLERLISSTIRIGTAGIHSMGYRVRESEFFGSVLPAKFMTEVSVNGSKKTVVQFLDESPLVAIAKVKNNQFLTYPLESLCASERSSPDKIALANYAIRRIEECRIHPQMKHTITFKTLFDKNGLADKSKSEKKRYRDILCRFFDYWKENGYISNYELIKSNGRSHGYHGISFTI